MGVSLLADSDESLLLAEDCSRAGGHVYVVQYIK